MVKRNIGELDTQHSGDQRESRCYQRNGETPILQLANLHGDIIATAYDSETPTTLASTLGEANSTGYPPLKLRRNTRGSAHTSYRPSYHLAYQSWAADPTYHSSDGSYSQTHHQAGRQTPMPTPTATQSTKRTSAAPGASTRPPEDYPLSVWAKAHNWQEAQA